MVKLLREELSFVVNFFFFFQNKVDQRAAIMCLQGEGGGGAIQKNRAIFGPQASKKCEPTLG